MKNLKSKIVIPIILSIFNLSGCALSDLRTKIIKDHKPTYSLTGKGRRILEASAKAHGFKKLNDHTTYEVKLLDEWPGPFSLVNPWGDNNKLMVTRNAINTFDSQYEFLEGKMKGTTYGLQSWKHYKIESGKKAEFTNYSAPLEFIMATFQYFFELPGRYLNSNFVTYAGEETYNGVDYDLVLITWGSLEPNSKNDQYLAYINKKTKLLEMFKATVRKFYIPSPPNFYGTVFFSNFKKVDGVTIPYTMEVYPYSMIVKPLLMHRVDVQEFKFDTFPKEDLYPFKELKMYGTSKP